MRPWDENPPWEGLFTPCSLPIFVDTGGVSNPGEPQATAGKPREKSGTMLEHARILAVLDSDPALSRTEGIIIFLSAKGKVA